MQTTRYEVVARYNIHLEAHTLTAENTIEHLVEVQRTQTADDITADLAAGALDIMAKAYGYQFEESGPRMPEGTFRRLFDSTDETKVHEQAAQMRIDVVGGSVYGFASDPEVDDSPVVIAKASPSRANPLQKIGWQAPNVYLNDIAVDPGRRGLRFASVALYDVLTSGRFERKRILALDGFVGNTLPNEWFERLGLHKVAADIEPFVVDKEQGLTLPQERYSSEGYATVEDVAEKLKTANDIAVQGTPT